MPSACSHPERLSSRDPAISVKLRSQRKYHRAESSILAPPGNDGRLKEIRLHLEASKLTERETLWRSATAKRHATSLHSIEMFARLTTSPYSRRSLSISVFISAGASRKGS